MNIVDDVLSVILSYVDVKNVLVCKKWRDVILEKSFVCKSCHKITHSFGNSLWYTHAIYSLPCHAFYDKTYILSHPERAYYYDKNLQIIRQCRGICLDAVHINGLFLRNINKMYKTDEIYLAAIKSRVAAIQYVEEEHLSEALIIKVLVKDGRLLALIPIKHQTTNVINVALKENGLALQFVLKPMTLNMCYTAVKSNGLALQFVPPCWLDKCIIKALKNNGDALQHVPPSMITLNLCIRALDSSIRAAKYVPKEYHHLFSRYKYNYGKHRYLKKNTFV